MQAEAEESHVGDFNSFMRRILLFHKENTKVVVWDIVNKFL